IGPPVDADADVGDERQCRLEPVLADIAPRADHVGDDVDMHRPCGGLVGRNLLRHDAVLRVLGESLGRKLSPCGAMEGIGRWRRTSLAALRPSHADHRFGASPATRAIRQSTLSVDFKVARVTAASMCFFSGASMVFFKTLAMRRATTWASRRSVSVNTAKIEWSASRQAKSTCRISRLSTRAASTLMRRLARANEKRAMESPTPRFSASSTA